jgi:microcin C transport system substrate-binding protein
VLRNQKFAHPRYFRPLQDVIKAEALDTHTVRFEFQGNNLRDLPRFVATLPILSKTYYSKVPVDQASLKTPLGSGPYDISRYKQGNFVVYKRRPDSWGRNLPVNRGRFNFDEIRYDYYLDRGIAFEAFKAGQYDLREEFTSKIWATGYDIAQVRDSRIKRLSIPDYSPSGAQGFFLNMRRDKFKDRRVRKALDYAFDFKWTNRNYFYDLYKRTNSFFVNSDLEAKGKPSREELELLEPFRDKLSPEVFGEIYTSPVSDDPGYNRKNLSIASKLLDEAGWTVKAGRRVNAKNEPLAIEFLLDSVVFEKICLSYADNLRRLGIQVSIRRVDVPQYQERQRIFDFDIVTSRFVFSPTPGAQIKSYWFSTTVNDIGGYNLSGISHPAVDGLTKAMLSAKSRNELRTAAHALDRVLRSGHYWVPQWYKATHHIAYWDRFSRPAIAPKFDRGIEDTWWYDAAKAAKLEKKG